jgi:PIN domain nuclease of toxin-antitoxin system
MIVLDASAFLAFLFREKGWEKVEPLIPEACMSSVNFSEVIGRFARDGHAANAVSERLSRSLTVVPFSLKQATLAAELLSQTAAYGLSLGDRACLALGLDLGVAIYTADRVWLDMRLEAGIHCIR